MEIFKQLFPQDSDVVVKQTQRGLCVSVRTPRPNPVWLEGKRGAKPGVKRVKVAEGDLRNSLLEAVRSDPGRGPSHYSRVPKDNGGPGASQERKEKMLKQLELEGLLVYRAEPKRVGRKLGGLYPA